MLTHKKLSDVHDERKPSNYSNVGIGLLSLLVRKSILKLFLVEKEAKSQNCPKDGRRQSNKPIDTSIKFLFLVKSSSFHLHAKKKKQKNAVTFWPTRLKRIIPKEPTI